MEDKDLLEFGLNANTLVFIKSDMLFSTRIISEPFMNIDRLLNMPDKMLIAKIKANDMKTMAETVSMITNVSEDTAPVLLKFKNNNLQLSIESTEAESTLNVPIESVNMISGEFYYNAKYFSDMLKLIRGDVDVYMTKRGVLYASNPVSEYMLTNSKKRSVKHKSKKTKKAA